MKIPSSSVVLLSLRTGRMMNFAVLILILTTGAAFGEVEIPLDMAENSVDNQYQDSTTNMSDINTYLEQERKRSDLGAAWRKGHEWCSDKKKEDDLGGINYCIALYVYSLNTSINEDFNNATRGGKTQYTGKTYEWYSLHFFLTHAVQDLKKIEKKNGIESKVVYRGTTDQFDVKNKEIRFGSFISSSLEYDVAKKNGKLSCFEIETCLGANIANYSANPDQKEVLIPPYEIFKVTKVSRNDSGCGTVYELKSTRVNSNLKCADVSNQASGKSLIYHTYVWPIMIFMFSYSETLW
ncbi:ecto-ADP-ribosyltransferase 4-like [Sardina pilchardus]|uniref:ecto-ADP-ribosyltransferase 4-like n=1 Tax=Sardina pilchardus TaxID=27697 RepID=UPI002E1109D8